MDARRKKNDIFEQFKKAKADTSKLKEQYESHVANLNHFVG